MVTSEEIFSNERYARKKLETVLKSYSSIDAANLQIKAMERTGWMVVDAFAVDKLLLVGFER